MPNGTRIRSNNVFGVVNDAPLSPTATAFNSNQLVLLPQILGDHAVITLDPIRQHGEPEIVIVTAHTVASTVATIQRGAYGTSQREHPQDTVWVHAALDEDFIEIETSASRPGDPYAGQLIFETDTDKYVARNAANSAWVDAVPLGAWVDYVPANTNITVGNGTQTARFTRVGRIVNVHWMLVFGSTTAFTGNAIVGLPVNSSGSITTNQTLGAGWVFDGSTQWTAIVRKLNAGDVALSTDAGTVNATSPATLNTNDIVSFTITYEGAS